MTIIDLSVDNVIIIPQRTRTPLLVYIVQATKYLLLWYFYQLLSSCDWYNNM